MIVARHPRSVGGLHHRDRDAAEQICKLHLNRPYTGKCLHATTIMIATPTDVTAKALIAQKPEVHP
jgi:hypothetical protein